MFWDVFALQRRYVFKGHDIRVQKTSLVNGMQYGLTIDSVKQDQVDAFAGTFSLFGVIHDGETTIPVEAIIRQRFLKSSYYVRINGATTRMERVRYGDL